ncbi:mediator of RNA polymerase II transcription subunit 7, partial [Phenoliferia sp. Uapishka_3]
MSSPSSAGSASPMAQDAPVISTSGAELPRSAPASPPPVLEGDDDLDTSFFPAPAYFYHRYTTANVALPVSSTEELTVPGAGTFTRADLEPPNPEWVLERGHYSVFGETWPVEEVLQSLEELGVREMFVRGADRTASLQTLLQALILSYTQLVSSLLEPPPSLPSLPPGEQPPTDPERLVEHIRLITINMHHLVNELRPVQARETLKAMMRAQIDARKAKTVAMRQKCAELTATLASLKVNLTTSSLAPTPSAVSKNNSGRPLKTEELERLRAAVDRLDEHN